MTTLTDTQALILRAASLHLDGIAAPPASLPPAPRGAVAKRLLEAGLVEVLETDEALHPGLTWKFDGAPVFLRITARGLQAIGVEADEGAQGRVLAASGDAEPQHALDAAEPGLEAPTGAQKAVGEAHDWHSADLAQEAHRSPQEAAEGEHSDTKAINAPTASTPPLTRATALRAAAQQVLAAWDNEAAGRTGLPAAIDALRAAMPAARPARQPRQPGAPLTPRVGTKQQAVLALLRRPEGASGPQMIEATGWAVVVNEVVRWDVVIRL